MIPSVSEAVTSSTQYRTNNVSFCVANGTGGFQAEDIELNAALTNLWENAVEQDLHWARQQWRSVQGRDGQALLVTSHTNCWSTTNVHVFAEPLAGGVPAVFRSCDDALYNCSSNYTHQIVLNSNLSYKTGSGSPTGLWDLRGILLHEMGHMYGMGHSGRGAWTWDTTSTPTMGSQAKFNTSYGRSLQQDDWSIASAIGGGAQRFWSANAGFEAVSGDFARFWGRSSTTQVDLLYLGNRMSGDRSIDIDSKGHNAYITTTYDPWTGPTAGFAVANDMDDTPTLTAFTYYKEIDINNPSGYSGGVRLRMKWNAMHYDAEENKGSEPHGWQGWSGYTTLKTCNSSPGTWRTCSGSANFVISSVYNSPTSDNAIAFRAYFESRSNGFIYMDRTGAIGGGL